MAYWGNTRQQQQWQGNQSSQPQWQTAQAQPQVQPQWQQQSAYGQYPASASYGRPYADLSQSQPQLQPQPQPWDHTVSVPQSQVSHRVVQHGDYALPDPIPAAPAYAATAAPAYAAPAAPRQCASRSSYSRSKKSPEAIAQALLAQENMALSVSAFVEASNGFFKNLGKVFVKGEISAISGTGHMYFSLKDATSSVNCVLFRNRFSQLLFQPAVGQTVLVLGEMSLYKKNGSFSINVESMVLAGDGMLMAQLRLLEQQLEREGVFSRNWPRPRVIQRVAVVTSLNGRARYDLTMNALRRNPMLELIFVEAKVQGVDAAQSIVQSLEFTYRNAQQWGLDAIVLTRGGGAFEDLLCFSSEDVVRMVARSPVYIISAVGHDEDRPLCDRAADVRVSTPTAAAIAITPITRNDLLAYIDQAVKRADNELIIQLDQRYIAFNNMLQRLLNSRVAFNLEAMERTWQSLCYSLDQSMLQRLGWIKGQIISCENRLLQHGLQERLSGYEQRLMYAQQLLYGVEQRLMQMGSVLQNYTQLLVYNTPWQGSLERYQLYLKSLEQRLEAALQQYLMQTQARLQRDTQILLAASNQWPDRLDRLDMQCQSLEQRLEVALQQYLQQAQERLRSCAQALDFDFDLVSEQVIAAPMPSSMQAAGAMSPESELDLPRNFSVITKHASERLALLSRDLLHLNPLYQLERGLSLTTLDGLHSVTGKELKVDDELVTLLHDATVYSKVTKLDPPSKILTQGAEELAAEALDAED